MFGCSHHTSHIAYDWYTPHISAYADEFVYSVTTICQIEKLRFLGILRFKFKLRFWFNLNLYREIRVFVFSGFRGCSIFNVICETQTNSCTPSPHPPVEHLATICMPSHHTSHTPYDSHTSHISSYADQFAFYMRHHIRLWNNQQRCLGPLTTCIAILFALGFKELATEAFHFVWEGCLHMECRTWEIRIDIRIYKRSYLHTYV